MRQRLWGWVLAGFLAAVIGVLWYIGWVNASHPAPWPMASGDAGHRNYTAGTFPTDPQVLWTVPLTEGSRISGPVIWQDGSLYVTTGTRVNALDRDGKKKWTWESKELIYTLALGRHGDLYVLTASHLYALGPDGGLAWEAEVELGQERNLAGTLLVGQGGVIYAGNRQYLYAFTSTGQRKWRFKGDNMTAGPVEKENGELAVMIGEELYVLTREGDTAWHRELGRPVGNLALAAGPGNRLFANTLGRFYTIEADGLTVRPRDLTETNPTLAVGKDFVQNGLTRFLFTSEPKWTKAGENQGARVSSAALADSQGNALLITIMQPYRGGRTQPVQFPLRLYGQDGSVKWSYDKVMPLAIPAATRDGRICFVGQQPESTTYELICIGDK